MAYKANTICFSCTFFLCLCHLHYFCSGLDYINADNWIHENGTQLVSAGDIFRLGFFTRKDRRYVGIWYSNRSNAIVWVANRDMPITINGSGTFGIDSTDGNLKVSDNISKSTYFSTTLASSTYWKSTAKLYDSGNLVLIKDRTNETLWESFKHPTDTFLPGMKMDANFVLTSWLNKEDPASGNFTFQLDTEFERGYLIIKKNEYKPHWRSGGESTTSFIPRQMNSLAAALLSDNPSPFSPYDPFNVSERVNNSRLLIRSDGKIEYLSWNFIDRKWSGLWSEPKGPCSVFKFCGVNSICKYNSDDKTPNCTCLPGYGPKDEKEWKASVFTGGCKQKSVEYVKDNNNTFVPMNLTTMLPNTPEFISGNEDNCFSLCQNDSTCRFYSSTNTSKRNLEPKGCWIWSDTDILDGFTDGGDQHILFVRVDHIGTLMSLTLCCHLYSMYYSDDAPGLGEGVARVNK